MPTPTEEVLAFFAEWGDARQTREAIAKRFTEETVWENVGIITTTGIQAATNFSDQFMGQYGIWRAEVAMDHVAATDNVVLTERRDIFFGADGHHMLTLKVMGILEMDGPRILKWRDYADIKGAGF